MQEEIAKLSGAEREAALCAFEYLLSCEGSAYKDFWGQHEAWLRGDRVQRFLPFSFLLTPYLECALWADLYPSRDYCDTRWATSLTPAKSVKASFLVKCRSSIVDYGASFELLQFHYDRWVLSKFTGRAFATRRIQLDLKYAMADMSDTPYCCYLNHMRLVDIHRQLGPASYFITLAPGAYSTQWHPWVLHAAATCGRRLLSCPVPEMLHMTHALREVVTRFLLEGPRSPFWVPHLHRSCVQAWAYRLEFQEGTRQHGANAAKPPQVPGRFLFS